MLDINKAPCFRCLFFVKFRGCSFSVNYLSKNWQNSKLVFYSILKFHTFWVYDRFISRISMFFNPRPQFGAYQAFVRFTRDRNLQNHSCNHQLRKMVLRVFSVFTGLENIGSVVIFGGKSSEIRWMRAKIKGHSRGCQNCSSIVFCDMPTVTTAAAKTQSTPRKWSLKHNGVTSQNCSEKNRMGLVNCLPTQHFFVTTRLTMLLILPPDWQRCSST